MIIKKINKEIDVILVRVKSLKDFQFDTHPVMSDFDISNCQYMETASSITVFDQNANVLPTKEFNVIWAYAGSYEKFVIVETNVREEYLSVASKE
jgi:hypothetical protein